MSNRGEPVSGMGVPDVIEVHGEHESGEGVVRWGWAVYDRNRCIVVGPLHDSPDLARAWANGYAEQAR